LLHPELEDITLQAKKNWSNSNIVIYTNGLLLSKLTDVFLKTMADSGIMIRVSQHLNTREYCQSLKKEIRRLRNFRVNFIIGNDYKFWAKTYKINVFGIPIPSNSNPVVAWSRCWSKRCTTIIDQKLYKCSHLPNFQLAFNEGVLPQDWSIVLGHTGISSNSTSKEILDYLKSESIKECCVCPEFPGERVVARQLSSEELSTVRNMNHQENAIKIKT
jgi:hypothetical protein